MLRCRFLLALFPILISCGGIKYESQSSHGQNSIDEEIASFREKLAQAQADGDDVAKAKSMLEISYLTEILEANDDLIERARLARVYKILRTELQKQIYEFQEKTLASGLTSEVKRLSSPEGYRENARLFTNSYHPLSLQAVKKVFRDFGDLYVNETRGGDGKLKFERVQVERPWSGYWYPFTDRSLYEGEAAPLRKFDLLMQSMGYESDAAGFERARFEGFRPDSWEGFCDGWAVASIMQPEPREALVVSDLSFSVNEQKALQTFAYLSYPVEMYGIKYMGNAQTDGAYQSLHPEGFHQVVISALSKDKRAVVIDDTAGIQVWNKPLFSYTWQISQDPERDYAYNVIAYAWLVRERWQQTDAPTTFDDVIAPVYKYRLYVDKADAREGKFRVIAGEWLDESYENHPGSVKYLKPNAPLVSHNKYFSKYMDIYRKHFLR